MLQLIVYERSIVLGTVRLKQHRLHRKVSQVRRGNFRGMPLSRVIPIEGKRASHAAEENSVRKSRMKTSA